MVGPDRGGFSEGRAVEDDFGLGIGIRWEAQVGERWIFRFETDTGRGRPGRRGATRPAVYPADGGAQVASPQNALDVRGGSVVFGMMLVIRPL